MGNKTIENKDKNNSLIIKNQFYTSISNFISSSSNKNSFLKNNSELKIKELSKLSQKATLPAIVDLAGVITSNFNKNEIFANNESIYTALLLHQMTSDSNEGRFVIAKQNVDDITNILGLTSQNERNNNLNRTLRSFCKYSTISTYNDDFFETIKDKKPYYSSTKKSFRSSDDIRYFSKSKLLGLNYSRNETLKLNEKKTKKSQPIKEEENDSCYIKAFHHLDEQNNIYITKDVGKFTKSKEYSQKIRKINMQKNLFKKLKTKTCDNNNNGFNRYNSNNFCSDINKYGLMIQGLPHEKSLLNFLKENLSPNNNSNNVTNNININNASHNKSNTFYKVDIKKLSNSIKSNKYCVNKSKKKEKKHHHFKSQIEYFLDVDQSYKKKIISKKPKKKSTFIYKKKSSEKVYYNDSVQYYQHLLTREKENLQTKDETVTDEEIFSNELENPSFSKNELDKSNTSFDSSINI